MAEATGLRSNALPYPVYGVPWTVVFPMLDADGDSVTGATTPDAEVSKNGDTFTDCTNESTEIATTSGVYYLTLTAAEMTADIVAVQAKSATAGMKTTFITLYPRKLVTLRSGTTQASSSTTVVLDSGASAIDDYYNGCLVTCSLDSTTEARLITDYVGSSKTATVHVAWISGDPGPDVNDTFVVYLPEGRQVGQADAVGWLGTAIATPDTAGYPKVTIKDGTGTGELDTASGLVQADVRQWLGQAVAAVTVNGVPEVDVTHWLGTAAATPTVAGVPEVDLTHVAGATTNVSTIATSVATLLAAIGTISDAAADGDPTNADTAMAYLKQLLNVLMGSAGIVAFPSAATPGNAVSMAEVLRQIYDEVAGVNGITPAAVSDLISAAVIADAVWDEDATAHQTQGTFGQAIGDPAADTNTIFKTVVTDAAGTNIAADIIALKAETASILDDTDDIGVAGAGLTALATAAELAKVPKSDGTASWNATALAALQSEANDALVAYDPPTKAELDVLGTAALGTAAELAKVPKSDSNVTWNATAAAQIQTEATDALNAYDPPTKTELDTGLDALPTAVENADALLKRDWTSVTGEADYSALNALRFIRNKVVLDSGILTVYGEDGTTEILTMDMTTDANADLITAQEPS